MSAVQTIDQCQAEPKISTQMRAVLSALTDNTALMDLALPHIDFKNESIDWDGIFAAPLSSGQYGACVWAFSIWTDRARENAELFEAALSMDANQKLGVLKALRLRWGLR